VYLRKKFKCRLFNGVTKGPGKINHAKNLKPEFKKNCDTVP
jgi:hypothetical protein